MFDEKVISKGFQNVVPAKIQTRKKRTLKDLIGLVKGEGDAVKSKKKTERKQIIIADFS